MYVSSGGAASNTGVMPGGYLVVAGGGVCSTTVAGDYRSGRMNVYSSGVANNTILSGSSATMHVYSGGTANSITTLGTSCSVWVSGGGVVNNAVISGGNNRLYIQGSGSANNVSAIQSGGVLMGGLGQISNAYIAGSVASLFISGGTAVDVQVTSDAWFSMGGITVVSNLTLKETHGSAIIGYGAAATNLYV